MKKILCIILLGIGISCCDVNYNNGQMLNEYEQNFSIAQFDSICAADSISNNLNDWTNLAMRSGEDGKVFSEYLYIKNNNVMYRLLKVGNDSVKISKRVTK